MAISSSTVWEVRAAGNDNNGGGFKTGASGTDYSQQNAPQFALTGVATAGAGATFLYAGATAAMVGNLLQVVSGTNFTTGFYEITSVSAGVSVTCDSAICTGVGAAGVINIGGALASIGKIGSATANQGAVAGNLICVKAGSYTIGANDVFNSAGTTSLPIRIVGYSATRPTTSTSGDGYQGRTAGAGLVTTNMPDYAYSAGFRFVGNGAWLIRESIKFSGSVGNIVVDDTNSGDSSVSRCIVTNSSTNGNAYAIGCGVRTNVYDCDLSLTGASGGNSVVYGSGARLVGCRISSVSTSAVGVGVYDGNVITSIRRCLVFGGSVGINVTVASATTIIDACTLTGCSSHGISLAASSTRLNEISNCMITDNGGYGIEFGDDATACVVCNNRFRDNASGATHFGSGWLNATNFGAVTTDTGGAATDYVAPGSNDYRLISASPGTSAAQPASASMGAFQRAQTSSGGETSFGFSR